MQSNQAYKLSARITLYPSEMGGRIKPVYSGYRPSFVFNSKIHYSGEIDLLGKDELKPGETSKALVRLLPAQTLKTLKPNKSFTISEGNKIIGTGLIESVELTEDAPALTRTKNKS